MSSPAIEAGLIHLSVDSYELPREIVEAIKSYLGPAGSLIVLANMGDNLLVPAFQLDATGTRCRYEVAHINYLVGVAQSPMDLVGWWQKSSIHLGGRSPLSLIGEVPPARLIQFAQKFSRIHGASAALV